MINAKRFFNRGIPASAHSQAKQRVEILDDGLPLLQQPLLGSVHNPYS